MVEKKANQTIKVKQTGSPIRRHRRQSLYLKSLGLRKMNDVREVVRTPAVEGLLRRLSHMVTVLEK